MFVKYFFIFTKVRPKRMEHLQKEEIILSELYFSILTQEFTLLFIFSSNRDQNFRQISNLKGNLLKDIDKKRLVHVSTYLPYFLR